MHALVRRAMSAFRRHHSESSIRRPATSSYCSPSGGGVDSFFSEQLSAEFELQGICRELLHSYKETQNWESVSQVAQALVTNSARIAKLKQQIEDTKLNPGLPYLSIISESEVSREPPLNIHIPGATSEENSEFESKPKEEKFTHLAEVSITTPSSHIYVNSAKVEAKDRDLLTSSEVPEKKTHLLCESSHKDPSVQVKRVNSAALGVLGHTEVNHNNSPQDRDHKQEEEGKEGDTREPDTPTLDLGDQHSVELNNISEYMESLVDHFEDLSNRAQVEESSVTEQDMISGEIQTKEVSCGGNAELEVPNDNRINYTSSESSGQFFSPRDSLYSDGGSDEDEERQFVDAESEKDRSPVAAWDDRQSSTPRIEESPNLLTVSKGCISDDREVYCVTLKRDTSLQLTKVVLDPMMRTYAEIFQLRDQLSSTFNNSMVTRFPFRSDLSNKNDDWDISHDLEQFLNMVAGSPDLNKTSIFINFLKGSGDCQEAIRTPNPLVFEGKYQLQVCEITKCVKLRSVFYVTRSIFFLYAVGINVVIIIIF